MIHLTELTREIAIKNELLRISKLEIENILPQLQKYLGQKVCTQTGKSKKFIINFLNPQPVPLSPGHHATNHHSYLDMDSSVWLKVKLCFNGGSYDDRSYYCVYAEESYYIGQLKNGFDLLSIEPLEKILKERNFEPVNLQQEIEKIEKYEALIIEAKKIRSSIRANHSNLSTIR